MVTVIDSIPVSDGITINKITRVGDIGEPGYSVYGEDLPACKKRNAHDPWHGATQGTGCRVSHAMPSRCYITESVYNYLTPEEREDARSRVRGIVANSYWKNGTCPYYPHYSSPVYSVSTARPMPVPDPCAGVVCEPECVGVDRYAMECKDGVCVRGALMEANSVECGYVKPVCTEGDKKPGNICSGGNWVPYTPEKKRLYVKFAIPWLDLLPGIPYEPWMIIPPGFKITEES